MLGLVRGLVAGLVDSGSLLRWDRARMLARRSGKKNNPGTDPFLKLNRVCRPLRCRGNGYKHGRLHVPAPQPAFGRGKCPSVRVP